MASESFSQLSEPFQPVEGLTLYPNQWLNIDSLRFEDLLFGYFLGILDLRAVIDIESERSKRGQILDARELHLISIAEDPEAVGTYLRDTQPEEIVEDRQARRLWLRVLLQLMVHGMQARVTHYPIRSKPWMPGVRTAGLLSKRSCRGGWIRSCSALERGDA